jgi:hypothetical protein
MPLAGFIELAERSNDVTRQSAGGKLGLTFVSPHSEMGAR